MDGFRQQIDGVAHMKVCIALIYTYGILVVCTSCGSNIRDMRQP